MLELMVCGLCSSLSFPYVQFPCNQVSDDQLYNYDPFWEAVERLKRVDFMCLHWYVMVWLLTDVFFIYIIHIPLQKMFTKFPILIVEITALYTFCLMSLICSKLQEMRGIIEKRNLWVCPYILPCAHL